MSRLATAAALGLALLSGRPASAQEPSLAPFSAISRGPAPGRANLYGVEGARIEGDLEPALGMASDTGFRPLTVQACPEGDPACIGGSEVEAVRSAAVFHLWASFAFGHRAQLALSLPIGAVSGESYGYMNTAGTDYNLSGGTRFGAGDPRMTSRIHLHGDRDDAVHVAVSADATLPLARSQGIDGDVRRFLGDARPAFASAVIVEWIDGRLRLAGNLGGQFRRERSVFDATARSALTYRVGFGYDVRPAWTLIAELDGASDLDAGKDGNPLELRAAARYVKPELEVTGGLGAGLVRGAGTPVMRLFVQFAWLPHERVSDDDQDGLRHEVDACPDEAEDFDGHRDDDGCPDHDNDGDGIPDVRDLCVDQAEDLDGHADDDGCLDIDSDDDRIEDGYDGCPNVPEDRDGDRDEDGCPE